MDFYLSLFSLPPEAELIMGTVHISACHLSSGPRILLDLLKGSSACNFNPFGTGRENLRTSSYPATSPKCYYGDQFIPIHEIITGHFIQSFHIKVDPRKTWVGGKVGSYQWSSTFNIRITHKLLM